MQPAGLVRLFYPCSTTHHLISETRNKNTDSSRFATILSNYGFDSGRPKIYKKTVKKLQKCATVKTGCDAKKQHCQSEMRAIPIYHLSQREMRLIELLSQVPPCLVREAQWNQVNVKMSHKKCKIVDQGLYQNGKRLAVHHSQKDKCSGLTVAHTAAFGLGFENIKVNAQNVVFCFIKCCLVILYYVLLIYVYKMLFLHS